MSDHRAGNRRDDLVVHHRDEQHPDQCIVCHDPWPCLTFLAYLGGMVA